MFKSFYNSFYQHPLLLSAGILLCAYFIVRRRAVASPLATQIGLGLCLLALLDAWLTANAISQHFSQPISQVLSFVFVYLGDVRYFAALAFLPFVINDAKRPPCAVQAGIVFLAALVVPVLSQGLYHWSGQSEIRFLFIIYEILFLFWPIVFLFTGAGPARLHAFVLLYYALWAFSDALILAGIEAGFLMRILPNLLYYAGMPWMVYVRATSNPEKDWTVLYPFVTLILWGLCMRILFSAIPVGLT